MKYEESNLRHTQTVLLEFLGCWDADFEKCFKPLMNLMAPLSGW